MRRLAEIPAFHSGLAIVALALVSDLRLAVALNVVVGFTHAGIGVYYGTELQQQTPGYLRGRVGAVSRIVSMTANPASLLAWDGW
ncbi:MAG TPA: hypothetical protein VLA19_23295 [Herpetosiphonaceae bacterium]|nr:hypothetical protein [Herpetosiphonaceae bacterium]